MKHVIIEINDGGIGYTKLNDGEPDHDPDACEDVQVHTIHWDTVTDSVEDALEALRVAWGLPLAGDTRASVVERILDLWPELDGYVVQVRDDTTIWDEFYTPGTPETYDWLGACQEWLTEFFDTADPSAIEEQLGDGRFFTIEFRKPDSFEDVEMIAQLTGAGRE